MRLNSYLNEIIVIDVDIDVIIKTLKKDCSQILQYYKTQSPLYRGAITSGVFFPKTGHKKRNPKDTPRWAHDYLNAKLQLKFGWNVRDGVSVSTQHRQASAYGTVHVIFPVNGFKWAYLQKIEDMFTFIDDHMYNIEMDNFKADPEAWKEKMKGYSHGNFKQVETTSPYRAAGLDAVLDEVVNRYTDKPWKGHVGEVLFNTKKYYLLNLGLADQFTTGGVLTSDGVADLFAKLDIFQKVAVTIK